MPKELHTNGVDANTGNYAIESITSTIVSNIARRKKFFDEEKKDIRIRRNLDRMKTNHLGVTHGVDASDLSQTGWSIVFPSNQSQKSVDAIREALAPLLSLRRTQAAAVDKNYYKEVSGPDGYRVGETKNDFLKRYRCGLGAADPEKFPYYILLVGDPETIPFSFQSQLDIQYAVGRIYFEKLEEYNQYATSIVRAETEKIFKAKKATFFGVENHDDPSTSMSSKYFVEPLANSLTAIFPDWHIDLVRPDQATKSTLSKYLGGDGSPTLFFSASHGINFKLGDPRQLRHQGSLLCQDWPGPKYKKPIPDQYYFSSDDLSSNANVFGMLAFFHASYGGGTPRVDNYYSQAYGIQKDIAPYSFIAKLPLQMLCHPRGGTLAVCAPVDHAWTTSIITDETVRDVATFYNMIKALMEGKPVGVATEYMSARYAEIASDLAAELESTTADIQDDLRIAGLWTSRNDASNYTIIGDPAVHLNLSGTSLTD